MSIPKPVSTPPSTAMPTPMLSQGAVDYAVTQYRQRISRGSVLKIMSVGDSITDGSAPDDPGAYRDDLQRLLSNAGYRFDFVGSRSDNVIPATYDQDHASQGGYEIDDILDPNKVINIRQQIQTYQPDVVLLMIGTNDVTRNRDLANAPGRLNNLIDEIIAQKPSLTVFVASIPPIGVASYPDARVAQYNAAIPGIVDTQQRNGKNVVFVDIFSRVDAGDLYDFVHPTTKGSADIANGWFDAIQRYDTERTVTDFDADGTSEILWRNSNDGSILMWKMQDNGVVSAATFAATIPNDPWDMAGSADFDGDDQLDLIGRNRETGDIKIWLLDANQQLKGEVEVAPHNRPGQDWQIVGIDDFNGDDQVDILWRHQTSGQFLNWYLGGTQGSELTSGALFDLSLINLGTEGVFPDLSWKVEATGDFNDDNAADIVWRNQTTGQISIWHMNEQATLIGGYVLDGIPDTNWEIVGSGDFDGNGKSDLFWQHKTAGATAIWSLDQGEIIGGGVLGNVDLNAWRSFV